MSGFAQLPLHADVADGIRALQALGPRTPSGRAASVGVWSIELLRNQQPRRAGVASGLV